MDSKAPTGDNEALLLSECTHRANRRRSNVWRRKFIFVAAFLSLWLGWKTFSGLTMFRWAAHYRSTEISDPGMSIPSDVTVEHCAEWQEPSARMVSGVVSGPRYETSTEFELPISSDKLFLMARGMASGGVTIRQDGEGDVARVEIVAQYRRFEDLQRVQACAINQGEGKSGVGIFGPQKWDPCGRELRFAVYLHLPVSSKGSVLNVKNLETDMPLFGHHVDDLKDGVYFDSISFKTANMPIDVKSVHATTAHTETTNAAITGSYNVTSSLALSTSNAKIDVTANLYNDKDAEGATVLTLHTENASIRGQLNLVSDRETGSAFAVAASTHNAGIDMTFLSAPVDSALSLTASTSLGSAKVKLHETYQGSFNLKTSLSRPKVVYDPRVTDPAGGGRRRKVDVRQRGSSIEGSATWSEEGLELGSVDVESSLASVTLTL